MTEQLGSEAADAKAQSSAQAPLIVRVIHLYNPTWTAPKDTGKTWLKCVCAFHSEDHASAAVSYELDCYTCQACPARGNAVTLISQQDGVSFRDASATAKNLALGGDGEISASPPRNAGRRLPFQQRTNGGGSTPVRSGIRSRTGSWSRDL